MARNRQDIPRELRVSALVRTATELFVTQGIKGTTMATVARTCGLAPSAVHWYFPSKDDLVARVFRDSFQAEVDRIDADPRLRGDPAAAMVTLIRGFPGGRKLAQEVYERASESEAVRQALDEFYEWTRARLHEAVTRSVPAGVSVEKAVEFLGLLFQSLLVSNEEVPLSAEDAVKQVVDVATVYAVALADRETEA